jgi:hypothetical protein
VQQKKTKIAESNLTEGMLWFEFVNDKSWKTAKEAIVRVIVEMVTVPAFYFMSYKKWIRQKLAMAALLLMADGAHYCKLVPVPAPLSVASEPISGGTDRTKIL